MNTPRFQLTRRLTSRYRKGWDHLNEHQHVGSARVLFSKPFRKQTREAHRAFILLAVSSKEPSGVIEDAIRSTLRTACRCEHDCCGCLCTSVHFARPLKAPGLWAVVQSSYPNI